MIERALHVFTALGVEAATVRSGLWDRSVRVERCGVGPLRARRAAERHDPSGAGALAVAGVCGALDPALAPGTVFVPDRVQLPSGEALRCDADGLLRELERRHIEVATGALVGSPRLLTGSERAVWAATTGARAVDMETPWLAAASHGRPFAVLRVVVDGPGHEVHRASLVGRGLRALRVLRRASPSLVAWARATDRLPRHSIAAPPRGSTHAPLQPR